MSLLLPMHVWIEWCDASARDVCDVIIEMEDGILYTAVFVTLDYLHRQMDFSYAMSKQLPDTPPVRYVALETPHVVVQNMNRDTIEDTIDNLLALDVFEAFFTQVNDDDDDGQPQPTTRTTNNGKRATTEVAAVVISDVLTVE